jgi:translocation and assembly module TamB
MRYADLLLDARLNAFLDGDEVLNGAGALPLDLRFGPTERRLLDRPITASIVMERFPAAFMLGFTTGFSSVDGVFQGSIEANGNARSPELSGALVLVGGAATWDATGVRYVDAEGTFLMDRELSAALDFTARTINPRTGARGGTARMRGDLDLSKPTDPGFDIQIVANRIQAAQRRDVEMQASGTVDIGGQYTSPEISGAVTIDQGTLYIDELYRQYLIVQLEDPLLFEVIDTTLLSGPRVLPQSSSPFLRNLRIQNMAVVVGSDSWLRGREINVEVAGQLNVFYARAEENLRVSGTLEAVRGTYRLEYPPITRSFDVRDGTVEFPGTPGIDPNLNITAVYTAPRMRDEPLDIIAQVTGTLQSPRVQLSSDAQPPISESDLASYLFLGAPTYAFNASSSSSVFGNLGRQVVTNTGLGFFASGLQTLGQSFGLLDYVGLTAGETAPGQESSAGFFAGTKIELGRYVTPRLFVTYVQRLNSSSNDPGIRAEWRFMDTFTAEIFALDRFARLPSFGLSRAIAARREYGFFLFREWGY